MRDLRTIPPDTDQLGRASVFAAVARNGSFTGAAKALGLGNSTVSGHVRALESHLGVQLLQRSTRQLSLTDEGRLLLEKLDGILELWDDALSQLATQQATPSGLLRVTAPAGLAFAFAGGVLAQMLQDFPDLSTELVVDDKFRDLIAERIDVAIRVSPLQDSRLRARKLGDTRLRLVGAPEVVDALQPGLDSILEAAWVGHPALLGEVHLHELGSEEIRAVRPNFRSIAGTGDGQISLLRAGAGLALLPALLVDPDLKLGLLKEVPGWRGGFLPIYTVFPESIAMPPRVRVFIDRLVEHFHAIA